MTFCCAVEPLVTHSGLCKAAMSRPPGLYGRACSQNRLIQLIGQFAAVCIAQAQVGLAKLRLHSVRGLAFNVEKMCATPALVRVSKEGAGGEETATANSSE
jgi:hypothetical protein